MFGPKVKLSAELYEKAKEAANAMGCSLEEFVAQSVQKGVDRAMSKRGKSTLSAQEVEEVTSSLKGLGYLE